MARFCWSLRLWLLVVLLGGAALLQAAPRFDAHSDRLTHPYLGLHEVGDAYWLTGYGAYAGAFRTYRLTAAENRLGVRCVNLLIHGHGRNPAEEYYVYRLAQDTAGDVYYLCLTGQAPAGPIAWEAASLDEAVLFLPADLAMWTRYGDDGRGGYHQVLGVGVTIPPAHAGMPAFADCVEVRWQDGRGWFDTAWYAPDAGVVLEIWNGNSPNGWQRSHAVPVYDTQPAALVVAAARFRAGPRRDRPADAFSLTLTGFAPAGDALLLATTLDLRLYRAADPATPVFQAALPCLPGAFRHGRFAAADAAQGVATARLDLGRQQVQLVTRNLDLTGLACPATVSVRLGTYEGVAVLDEDVVNGDRQDMPVQYLAGAADSLTVTAAKLRLNRRRPESDTLLVQGGITVTGGFDVAAHDVVFSWGDFEATIPAGTMTSRGNGYSFKPGRGDDTTVGTAQFDFDKCTYKVMIKQADIGDQGSPVEFGLTCGDFNQTVSVTP